MKKMYIILTPTALCEIHGNISTYCMKIDMFIVYALPHMIHMLPLLKATERHHSDLIGLNL